MFQCNIRVWDRKGEKQALGNQVFKICSMLSVIAASYSEKSPPHSAQGYEYLYLQLCGLLTSISIQFCTFYKKTSPFQILILASCSLLCFFPRGAQGKAGWGPDLMRGSQLMAGGWNQMDFIMSPPTYATVWKRIFRNNFQIKKKTQLKHRKKIKYPKSTDILVGVQSRGLQCSTGQFPLCQH